MVPLPLSAAILARVTYHTIAVVPFESLDRFLKKERPEQRSGLSPGTSIPAYLYSFLSDSNQVSVGAPFFFQRIWSSSACVAHTATHKAAIPNEILVAVFKGFSSSSF
jgi:hypothetical protein